MNKKSKRKIIEVGVLEDPTPSFVSLVSRGANNTPFRVFKSLDKMEIDTQVAEPVAKSSGKGRHAQIAKIEFDGASFSHEDDVDKWMQAKDYENFTIEKAPDESNFFVAGVVGLKDVRGLDMGEGVTIYLGHPETQKAIIMKVRDRTRTSEKAEKVYETLTLKGNTPEQIEKLDFYAMVESDSSSLSEILANANDGIPLGVEELMTAFHVALGNGLKARDYGAVKSASGEFADILVSLSKLMESVAKSDTDKGLIADLIQRSLQSKHVNNTEMDTEVKKTEVEEVEKAEEVILEASDATKAEDKVGGAVKSEASTKENTVDEAKKSEEVAEAAKSEGDAGLKDLIHDLAQTSKALQESLKDQFASVKSELADMKEINKEQAKRLEEIEGSRQSRKSGEVIEAAAKQEKEDTEKGVSDPLARALFGFSGK
jgi:hypothetical protein